MNSQTHPDIEHVVVDGASTDGTLELLRKKLDDRSILISEPDRGIYYALNKGLAKSTGDVVGILHSDDVFADQHVLEDVAKVFSDPTIDAVYGDLQYVSKLNAQKIIRHWVAGEYTFSRVGSGWMPPHPTLFLRRELLKSLGNFDTSYRISADYDFILRFFSRRDVRVTYIKRVLVKMRSGGESNGSFGRILKKSREDYIVLQSNGVGGLSVLLLKNLSKLRQFFHGFW
jgi:glycosyltransferase